MAILAPMRQQEQQQSRRSSYPAPVAVDGDEQRLHPETSEHSTESTQSSSPKPKKKSKSSSSKDEHPNSIKKNKKKKSSKESKDGKESAKSSSNRNKSPSRRRASMEHFTSSTSNTDFSAVPKTTTRSRRSSIEFTSTGAVAAPSSALRPKKSKRSASRSRAASAPRERERDASVRGARSASAHKTRSIDPSLAAGDNDSNGGGSKSNARSSSSRRSRQEDSSVSAPKRRSQSVHARTTTSTRSKSVNGTKKSRRVRFNERNNQEYEDHRRNSGKHYTSATWYTEDELIEFRGDRQETLWRAQSLMEHDRDLKEFRETLLAMFRAACGVDYELHDAQVIQLAKFTELFQHLAPILPGASCTWMGLEVSLLDDIQEGILDRQRCMEECVRDIQEEKRIGLWPNLNEYYGEVRDSCHNYSQASTLFAQLLAQAQRFDAELEGDSKKNNKTLGHAQSLPVADEQPTKPVRKQHRRHSQR